MQLPITPDPETGTSLSNIIVWAFYGLGGGIVILLARMGIIQGKASAAGPDPNTTMQLAGAIIDNKKADELISALDRNTESQEKNSTAQDYQTDAMRSLTIELVRRNR